MILHIKNIYFKISSKQNLSSNYYVEAQSQFSSPFIMLKPNIFFSSEDVPTVSAIVLVS